MKRKFSELLKSSGSGSVTYTLPPPPPPPPFFDGNFYCLMCHLGDIEYQDMVKTIRTHVPSTNYYFCEETGEKTGLHIQGWIVMREGQVESLRKYLKRKYQHLVRKSGSTPLTIKPVRNSDGYQKYVCKEPHDRWLSNFYTEEMRAQLHTLYHESQSQYVPGELAGKSRRSESCISKLILKYDMIYTPIYQRLKNVQYANMEYEEAYDACVEIYQQVSMMSGYNVTKKAVETILVRYSKYYNNVQGENIKSRLFM